MFSNDLPLEAVCFCHFIFVFFFMRPEKGSCVFWGIFHIIILIFNFCFWFLVWWSMSREENTHTHRTMLWLRNSQFGFFFLTFLFRKCWVQIQNGTAKQSTQFEVIEKAAVKKRMLVFLSKMMGKLTDKMKC